MRFQWNGSTWTTGVDDSPSFALDTADNTEAQIQRTFYGTARNVYRWNKKELSLRWENIGTLSPQTHVRNMLTAAGTVNIAYADGTSNFYAMPGSLQTSETAYSLYTITAQFTEI